MIKILIVEDERPIANLLAKLLESFGQIDLAYDGASAYVKYLKHRHNLIICDVAMPISDGLSMAAKIRALNADVPIVIASAYSEQNQLLKAIDLKVSKYLIKPINPEELLTCVSNLLEQSSHKVSLKGACVDFEQGKFICSNQSANRLSSREIELLRQLVKGNLLSKEQIKQLCWPNQTITDAAVRTLINRLKNKMGEDAHLLNSINNMGYQLLLD